MNTRRENESEKTIETVNRKFWIRNSENCISWNNIE